MGTVRGTRVLVVGASSGLGRGIAERLHDEGARVAVAARRAGLLSELVEGRLRGATAIVGDVADPDDCRAMIDAATGALGGLDALVYAPGTAVVVALERATSADWHDTFAVNVVGASLVTAAAMPHLEATEGVAIYLSSVSASLTPPWVGMGIYASTKVAMEKMVQVYKLEHPRVRFSTLVVGSTSGGEFFDHARVPRPDDMEGFIADWRARGYLAAEQLDPADQAQAVVDVIESRAQIDVMWVRPRTQLQLPPD